MVECNDSMQQPPNRISLARPLVYVDTEWTELNPETRRIVSIAITRFNPDGSQERAYWLVNPRVKISEQSSKIHGIRQKDVAHQPTFQKISSDVEKMLKDADIAGYSVTNDIEIIEKEMARAGKRWSGTGRRIIDAYRLWQVREPRTLSDAYRRFVGTLPEGTQAHDARHDVDMTIAIINAMQDGKNVADLHDEAHPDMIDPAGKFRMEDGQAVYNFGPYRSCPVSDYPEYLDWMLSKSFAPSTVETIHALLSEIERDEPCDYYPHTPFDEDDEDWD